MCKIWSVIDLSLLLPGSGVLTVALTVLFNPPCSLYGCKHSLVFILDSGFSGIETLPSQTGFKRWFIWIKHSQCMSKLSDYWHQSFYFLCELQCVWPRKQFLIFLHLNAFAKFSTNQHIPLHSLFFHFYVFLRDRAWVGEGQRDRETQNVKQAPGSELSAQSLTRSLNPWIMRSWPEPKSDAQLTQPPRCPWGELSLSPWNFEQHKMV